MARKTKIIGEMVLKNKAGKQTLYLKFDKSIEGLFKTPAVETSENYKDHTGAGLDFYKLKPDLDKFTSQYMSKTGERVSLQRYGTDFYIDGYPNVSILRTKGISKGIEIVINNLIIESEVQRYYSQLARYVKFLHDSFIATSEIKGTISLTF